MSSMTMLRWNPGVPCRQRGSVLARVSVRRSEERKDEVATGESAGIFLSLLSQLLSRLFASNKGRGNYPFDSSPAGAPHHRHTHTRHSIRLSPPMAESPSISSTSTKQTSYAAYGEADLTAFPVAYVDHAQVEPTSSFLAAVYAVDEGVDGADIRAPALHSLPLCFAV